MAGPWAMYDELIDLVPGDRRVTSCAISHWAAVTDDAGGAGVAMVYRDGPHDWDVARDFVGRPLRDLAAHVRSWDLPLASLGAAALNCGLTTPGRLAALPQRPGSPAATSTFELHEHRLAGRRVAAVGNFASLGRLRRAGHDLVVLERRPTRGDLPDTAAEFVLPECDLVFVTGSTVVNKTLPRLLELCAGAEVVLVGPTTPLAPEVFTGRVSELGGSLCVGPDGLVAAVATGATLTDLRPRMQQYNVLLPHPAG